LHDLEGFKIAARGLPAKSVVELTHPLELLEGDLTTVFPELKIQVLGDLVYSLFLNMSAIFSYCSHYLPIPLFFLISARRA